METVNDIKAFEMRSVFIYRLIVPVSFYLLVYGEEKQCKRLHIKKIKKIKNWQPLLQTHAPGCGRKIWKHIINKEE